LIYCRGFDFIVKLTYFTAYNNEDRATDILCSSHPMISSKDIGT